MCFFFLGFPDQIQNVSVVAITATSVLLEWVEPNDNSSPIRGYMVGYTMTLSLGDINVTIVVADNRLNVTGLCPTTAYNFSVVAFNDIGSSPPSTIMVTTDEAGMYVRGI